jgi:hypothetical protein
MVLEKMVNLLSGARPDVGGSTHCALAVDGDIRKYGVNFRRPEQVIHSLDANEECVGATDAGAEASLVTQSVRVYAQAAEADTYHLRTQEGRQEIDLIIQRHDQRVLALEVKLNPVVNDDDVRHLRWLQQELGADVVDAAVITTGRQAYRRVDGIAVIPAALLGP